jgi:ankyrin repeat protein
MKWMPLNFSMAPACLPRLTRSNVSSLEAMASAGLDVNQSGKRGMTLLVWSMNGQKKRSMRALLGLRASPNAKLDNGDTSVTLAAGADDGEMLRLLLEHEGNPNAKNGKGAPAIFEALDRSLLRNFDLLMTHGADINATDGTGQTITLRVAILNRFSDVEKLIERGADVNVVDHLGGTLAWYLQDAPSGRQDARDRVRAMLERRGVRFPVALQPLTQRPRQ